MNFILYTVSTDGTQQWSETQTVTVTDGIYNVQLGADTAFPADLFANNQVLYLEVEVKRPTDIDWETLAPRQQLTSTAYAMKAEKAVDADLLDGKDSAEFAQASHSHSGSDITSGTVADSWIAATITRDSELDTGLATKADSIHPHSGSDITSGTVADARIATSIARDSEIMPTVLASDGSGSGLDADKLDDLDSSAFAPSTHAHDHGSLSGLGDDDHSQYFHLSQNETVTGRPAFNGGTSGSTAPFAVDSTYKVANLNADLLDGKSASAFGDITGVTAGTGLTGGGTSGGVTLDVEVPLSLSSSSTGAIITGTNSSSGASGCGVYGENSSFGNYGFLGSSGYGVFGSSSSNRGVYGYSSSSSGVHGLSSSGSGVSGYSSSGRGVSGYSTSNYAGYFNGEVEVTGTLTKGGGSFKIDHPLDPENKYLQHSFVESPDMMNIYNGNVVLDATGQAWVELPEWFEALNKDFRYQLTCIGGFAQVYIAEEVSENRFKIAGGTAGMKVSWQVTGIRQDPWAEANRIVVEEDKPDEELGFYLHPELYGQAEEKSIEWARNPEMMQRMKEMKELERSAETDRPLEVKS